MTTYEIDCDELDLYEWTQEATLSDEDLDVLAAVWKLAEPDYYVDARLVWLRAARRWDRECTTGHHHFTSAGEYEALRHEDYASVLRKWLAALRQDNARNAEAIERVTAALELTLKLETYV